MANLSILSVIFFNVVACFEEISYDITINKMEQLSPTNNSIINFRELKLRKFNRTTQIWSGPYEAYVDIDNSVKISLSAFKKTGNEWRLIPYRVPPTPYCDYSQTENFYFDIFIEHSDLPPKGTCPAVSKGKHVLKDLPLGTAKFPPFLEGEYWVQQKYTYKGDIVDELSIFCILMHF